MADWTSEEWNGALSAGAVPRRDALPRGVGPWLGRLVLLHPRMVAAVLVVAVVLALALARHGPGWRSDAPATDLPPAAGEASWSPILKPVPAFALDTPLFPRDQVTHTARRHNPGGGREDVFALGRPEGPQGLARVVVYRTGSEAAPAGTLFLELARRAAAEGYAILRSAQPAPLATKFGPVETADLVLSGAGGEQRCAAWRVVAEDQDLRVTGWLCPPGGRPVERTTLACFIDRLDLAPAQADAGLRAFFAQAERRRVPGCPAARPAPAGRRPA